VATAEATANRPIVLCATPDAVLAGEGPEEIGYVLHLDGADHWRVVGLTVRDGRKGVMVDGGVGNVLQGLTVTSIGDEGIHLRSDSTDNLVIDNVVSDTGIRRDKFGEGIYVGTAQSNWCEYTDCEPDRSDRNRGRILQRALPLMVTATAGTPPPPRPPPVTTTEQPVAAVPPGPASM